MLEPLVELSDYSIYQLTNYQIRDNYCCIATPKILISRREKENVSYFMYVTFKCLTIENPQSSVKFYNKNRTSSKEKIINKDKQYFT